MTAEEPEDRFGASAAHQFLQHRLDRIDRVYGQAMTRLWLANGAGATGTATFLGATWKDGKHVEFILPLSLFALGLVALAIGELWLLVNDMRAVRRNQNADSILDVKLGDVESPLQHLGLSCGRLVAQAVGASFFILGLITAIALIYCS